MNNSKPKNGIASIPNKFLVVAVAFLGSVFLFAGITHETVIEKEELFDQRIAAYLQAQVGERLIGMICYSHCNHWHNQYPAFEYIKKKFPSNQARMAAYPIAEKL